MGTFADFLEKMPMLCGCKNPEQKAWMILAPYKAEIAGEKKFSLRDQDRKDPKNRCEPVFCLLRGDPDAYHGAIDQCERLVHIVEYTHYINIHGETGYNDLRDAEVEAAMAEEENYPEISAVMTAQKALATIWNP